MHNPLLDFSDLPRFDAIKPEHVGPAIDHLIAKASAAVVLAESVTPVTWEGFYEPLESATEQLSRAWGVIGHLKSVVSTPALRDAFNEVQPKMTSFWTRFGQNQAIFAQFQRLTQVPGYAQMNPVRQRVVEHNLRNFQLSGVGLVGSKRDRFSDISAELSRLATKFSENVLDATDGYAFYVESEEALTGVPADVIASCRVAAEEEGRDGYRLSLQMPCYRPVLTYAENRELRCALYLANIVRASDLGPVEQDNGPLIGEMLGLRKEMSDLLGFNSYANYSLVTKMADTPQQVLRFLRTLAEHALPYARRERAELQSFAHDTLGLDALEPWDLAWASEKLKQARYAFSQQEVKQYFTEPKVLAGLFGLIESLYGVRFEMDQTPTWHSDVRFYRVVDADGLVLGQCYMDLYAREGKESGAWMNVCRNRHRNQGSLQTSVVYLVCNFGRGVDGQRATLSHSDVVTLFHEMGHCLHQLLTEVDEPELAGIHGVEWDAVELPSQFMENFAWEWENVRSMSSHVETGAPLPKALFDRMLASKNFQCGMATVRQLELALLDMLLHCDFDPETGDVLELNQRVRAEVAVNPAPECDRSPYQFSHIFAGAYSAGYYSYKWAEVLSADAYYAFSDARQEPGEMGAQFRREVLSRGGSRPALENFRAFRGRDPEVSALLKLSGMAT